MNEGDHLKFLEPAELKLQRAAKLLSELTVSVSNWNELHPIKARCELRDERMGYKLILDRYDSPETPQDWSLCFGEIVHNLRSGLDNLAFALARTQLDPPTNPRAIHFPICEKETQLDRTRLNQLPEKAVEMIERIQPYHRNKVDVLGCPEQDPLVLLQKFSNTDKHQIPPVVLVAPERISLSTSVKFYSDEDASANVPPDVTVWAGPLEPEAVLLEYRTNCAIEAASGDWTGAAVAAVESNQEPLPVLKISQHLCDYTALVVDHFRGFF